MPLSDLRQRSTPLRAGPIAHREDGWFYGVSQSSDAGTPPPVVGSSVRLNFFGEALAVAAKGLCMRLPVGKPEAASRGLMTLEVAAAFLALFFFAGALAFAASGLCVRLPVGAPDAASRGLMVLGAAAAFLALFFFAGVLALIDVFLAGFEPFLVANVKLLSDMQISY